MSGVGCCLASLLHGLQLLPPPSARWAWNSAPLRPHRPPARTLSCWCFVRGPSALQAYVVKYYEEHPEAAAEAEAEEAAAEEALAAEAAPAAEAEAEPAAEQAEAAAEAAPAAEDAGEEAPAEPQE